MPMMSPTTIVQSQELVLSTSHFFSSYSTYTTTFDTTASTAAAADEPKNKNMNTTSRISDNMMMTMNHHVCHPDHTILPPCRTCSPYSHLILPEFFDDEGNGHRDDSYNYSCKNEQQEEQQGQGAGVLAQLVVPSEQEVGRGSTLQLEVQPPPHRRTLPKKTTNSIRTKLELCQSILKGIPCPFGNTCNFAHHTSELELTTLRQRAMAGMIDIHTYRSRPCINYVMTGSW
eukprot:CAMPEP_0176499002 /NCGR_PEP_ID=MMETSP0200_2-20121128/12665_1 /TAXON_ID=947934 /ORGANISM="Chaetoceros sp., Strain GSL56" /LENGTH=229 /DNA_ID=CAMNT_0017897333 /DNA_START=470 /DNA_END=1159 /DNA_ORIENTATION=+